MSATDELRKLLDDAGVEWKAYDARTTCQTWWTGAHGILWNATEVNGTGRNALNIKTTNLDVTPAQAIEATLGRGVCHDIHEDDGYFRCSECGGKMHGWTEDDNAIWFSKPRFCPNCGAKVVEG